MTKPNAPQARPMRTATRNRNRLVGLFACAFVVASSILFERNPAQAADPQPSSSSSSVEKSLKASGKEGVKESVKEIVKKTVKETGKETVTPPDSKPGQQPAKPAKSAKTVEKNVDIKVKVVPAQPGQPGQPKIQIRKIAPAEMRDVAYLGVATAPVPRELGVHLKLAQGFGLMIVHVEKDSPADKAGLKPDDVLYKLGDQMIINTSQLGTLVRSRKKDDKVNLSVFRKGELKSLTATLAEKKMPVFTESQPIQLRAFQFQPGDAANNRLQPRAGIARFQVAPMRHMKWHDGTHELSITKKDGKKHLIAKDKEGNVLFDGSIQTDEDRKAVPDAIKPKLEKLEKSARLQVIPLPNAPADTIPGLKQGNVDHRRIMQMIDEHLSKLNQNVPVDRDERQADKRIEDLRKRIHDDLQSQLKQLELDIDHFKAQAAADRQVAGNAVGQRLFTGTTAMASFSDKEHSLVLKVNNDGKHLVARDKAGAVLFEGPVNDEAQRNAVPAPLLAKLKTLEDSTKISVRLNGRRILP